MTQPRLRGLFERSEYSPRIYPGENRHSVTRIISPVYGTSNTVAEALARCNARRKFCMRLKPLAILETVVNDGDDAIADRGVPRMNPGAGVWPFYHARKA